MANLDAATAHDAMNRMMAELVADISAMPGEQRLAAATAMLTVAVNVIRVMTPPDKQPELHADVRALVDRVFGDEGRAAFYEALRTRTPLGQL